MCLIRVLLATNTFADDVDCVCVRREPVITMAKCLRHQRASTSVMTAVAGVDVVEYLLAFVLRHAALEHARDAALVELVVDDGEGFAAPDDLSRFHFIRG